MKFENSAVTGFEAAFRGMRNPLESWNRSDSYTDNVLGFVIGEKDMELAQKLILGGPPHSKFLRYIHASVDMTAPLYIWKEFDTYKVGTVANSTSTMHKLASTPITLDCFETDDFDSEFEILPFESDLTEERFTCSFGYSAGAMAENIIEDLECLRQKYNETKDKRYWKELIRWLPEGWLQTRTIDLNYEVLRNIVYWREGHKLSEWGSFIEWARTLPYANELIFYRKGIEDDKER